MKLMNVALAAVGALATVNADTPHPVLPTEWRATVNEPEVGVVFESYRMIDKPTPANPSGKWTNFTDGSCQRLIYDGDLTNNARYLLGCDSVPCCTEEQSGNHLEYQIPNVHPKFLAPVSNLGKRQVSQQGPDGKPIVTECDTWTWNFGIGKWFAYTTNWNKTSNEATLVRWVVSTEGKNFTNDYFDVKTIPGSEESSFAASFNVPAICEKAMSCGDANKKGLLKDDKLKFVRGL
jgi:hypothetical protein